MSCISFISFISFFSFCCRFCRGFFFVDGFLGGRLVGHSRRNAQRVAQSATEPFRDQLPPGHEYLDLHEHQRLVGEELEVCVACVVVGDAFSRSLDASG